MKRMACLFPIITLATATLFGQPRSVVYLDASKSMRAFMTAGHADVNTYQTLLLKLGSIMVASGIGEASIRTVGGQISSSKPLSMLNRFANLQTAPGSFVENETNLVGVLGEVLSERPGIAVLITDGVLSKDSKSAASGSCMSGYDLGCFMSKFGEILEKGWAVTLVGITSWFQGVYYSEDLAMRGDADIRVNAAEGCLRPFYLFCIGRNAIDVENFLREMRQWYTARYGDSTKGLIFRSLRISPPSLPSMTFSGDLPELIKDDNNIAVFAEAGAKGVYKLTGKKMKGKFVAVELAVEINLDKRPGQDIDILDYYVLEKGIRSKQLLEDGKDFSIKKKPGADGTVRYTLFLSPRFVRMVAAEIKLEVFFKLRRQPQNRGIWGDWSTLDDSSTGNIGKTLNLNPLLDYLIVRSLQSVDPARGEPDVRITMAFRK
jgi:hypothetical protein